MSHEAGTEQFTVETRVDGERIRLQEIHDPFVRTTIKLKGWRHAWNAIRHGITINVNVDGSHGAIRAVMQLDPEKLKADSEEFLREMKELREKNGTIGHYADSPVIP